MSADTALEILAEAVRAVLAAHAAGLTEADTPIEPVSVVAALRGPAARRQLRAAELDLAATAVIVGAPRTAAAEAARCAPVTIDREMKPAAQVGP